VQHKNELIDALLKEISLTTGKQDEIIETIYFGGGTPSLLSEGELNEILYKVKASFIVSADAEITLEANPDDISAASLNLWKHAGINRLSIGIQSFFQQDLEWMNRAHDAKQAAESIELAMDAGFTNFSIDLIFGAPGLSDSNWEKNVMHVIAKKIPHISCYALTAEPKTALQKMIEKKITPGIDADQQARQYLLLMQWLEEAGYEHYEISNFALPGMQSRHNSSYWQGKTYFGFGPSAHSYKHNTRSWNISNNMAYIKSLEKNIIPAEKEVLTPVQQLNEYIMTRLRLNTGLDMSFISENFGNDAVEKLFDAAAKHTASGKMITDNRRLYLTREGKLFADGIAADLFFGKL
jgi:oxygen-independent coproporphyrinogen III oxidase